MKRTDESRFPSTQFPAATPTPSPADARAEASVATDSVRPWRLRAQRLRGQTRRLIPIGTGVVATLLALLLAQWLMPPPQPLTTNEVNDAVAAALAEATPAPAVSSLVYQAILPSIVLVQVQRASGEDEEQNSGLGSGVVINSDGDILTSLHVVTQSVAITVTFADGTGVSAAVIAAVPEKDIAVLHPDESSALFVPAVLGNPRAMRVGDEAFVVGHPLGLYSSMSAGVISGFERNFRPPDGSQRLEGMIQFDAAVNPGNSGGPLLNRAGQVVGIVTGLANPSENSYFIGIGFAVPIDVAGGAAGLPPY